LIGWYVSEIQPAHQDRVVLLHIETTAYQEPHDNCQGRTKQQQQQQQSPRYEPKPMEVDDRGRVAAPPPRAGHGDDDDDDDHHDEGEGGGDGTAAGPPRPPPPLPPIVARLERGEKLPVCVIVVGMVRVNTSAAMSLA
jgi:hypothetical protein